MARLFKVDFPLWWRKGSTHFLALCWTAGLLTGMAAFFFADDILLLWMRGVPEGTVSIVGLLAVSVFPFLLSAFAVFIGWPRLLLLIAFWKAAVFTYVSCGLLTGFDSVGWLLRWFLMFSSLSSLPVLYWFWRRYIPGERAVSFAEVFLLLSLFVLLGSIDFCWISPFLANLI